MRQISSRIVRKLNAADGYLELGLPALALAELESIGEAGPLQPAVEFMRGISLKDQCQFDAAIDALQRAATTIPAPHNRDALLSLGECFRASGRDELADITEMFADEPLVPEGWDEVTATYSEVAKSDLDFPLPLDHADLGKCTIVRHQR